MRQFYTFTLVVFMIISLNGKSETIICGFQDLTGILLNNWSVL